MACLVTAAKLRNERHPFRYPIEVVQITHKSAFELNREKYAFEDQRNAEQRARTWSRNSLVYAKVGSQIVAIYRYGQKIPLCNQATL